MPKATKAQVVRSRLRARGEVPHSAGPGSAGLSVAAIDHDVEDNLNTALRMSVDPWNATESSRDGPITLNDAARTGC